MVIHLPISGFVSAVLLLASPAPPSSASSDVMGEVTPDVVDDTPPASAYDLQQQRQPSAFDSERTLVGQLVRTLISLVVVVVLILLTGKIVLPRLTRASVFGGAGVFGAGGKSLRIVERVQLDARHGLYVVEIEGRQRLLLGTGERGVQVLSHVLSHTEAAPEHLLGNSAGEDFAGSLAEANRRDVSSRPQEGRNG